MNFNKINELKPQDLNCNVFDVYSYDGLSMQELLCQFFTKINECVKTSNDTIDLAQWLVNEGLKQEVAIKLINWLNDGTLENLINVTLFENLNNKIDNVSSQLAHIKNEIELTPDYFDGTDTQKIQKCLDYAIENDIKIIKLNRVFDITGGMIIYNGGFNQPPTFIGGGIIKNDGDFMFTRNSQTLNGNSPLFDNVVFMGNYDNPCYIINGSTMIRQIFTNCRFSRIGLIKSDTYIQSLRIDNCEMTLSPVTFILAKTCYDVNITNNRFEESHKTLIHIESTDTGVFACNSLRITNNLIEGYVCETPIRLSSTYGMIIANNYFEYNMGDIEFVKTTGINVINGSINNNSFFRTKGNWHIKANGNNTGYLYINGNSSNITYADDKSMAIGVKIENITNTYINSGGRVVEKTTPKPTKGVKYEIINDNGKSALKIYPRTNTKSDILDLLGSTYLIKFSGTFGSSVYYRANYLGFLCVGGNWDSDNSRTCRQLTLTKISAHNINGATGSTNIWDESLVSIRFENSGTTKQATTTDDNIIITFNKIPYNVTYSRGNVININGISTIGTFNEMTL